MTFSKTPNGSLTLFTYIQLKSRITRYDWNMHITLLSYFLFKISLTHIMVVTLLHTFTGVFRFNTNSTFPSTTKTGIVDYYRPEL